MEDAERRNMLRYLHRHYVAWLAQGQWEPELSLPEGCYPAQGEWLRLEWRLSEPPDDRRRDEAERVTEACFNGVCELWAVCRGGKVSALAMANTLSTPQARAGMWVAAAYAAEEIQRVLGAPADCRASEVCAGYRALADAKLSELNEWWTARCAMPPQERREHRKRIQNYLKKGQYGHVGGYVARCLKRDERSDDDFWYWIPLVMESLWLQRRPSMAALTGHLRMADLAERGRDALIDWIRKTCAELKAAATPEDPIDRVTVSIRKDCSLPFSQTNLAEGLGLTPAYFSRLFEKRTGTRFTQYLTRARIDRARELLRNGASLAETAQATGFQRKSYFCEVFRKQTGMTAATYRAMLGKDDGR